MKKESLCQEFRPNIAQEQPNIYEPLYKQTKLMAPRTGPTGESGPTSSEQDRLATTVHPTAHTAGLATFSVAPAPVVALDFSHDEHHKSVSTMFSVDQQAKGPGLDWRAYSLLSCFNKRHMVTWTITAQNLC